MVWSELQLYSLESVDGYYQALFDWILVTSPSVSGLNLIELDRDQSIGSIQVLEEKSKGPKHY